MFLAFLFFKQTGYEMGENLFYSSELYSWNKVISAWHAELSHFRYPDTSTNGRSIGHYTQVTDSDNVSTKITDVLSHVLEVNHEVTPSKQCRLRNTRWLVRYQRHLCFPLWDVFWVDEVVLFLSWKEAITSTVGRSNLLKQNFKSFYSTNSPLF